MSNTLTVAEATLVLDLLELYDTAWDAGHCLRGCDCARCRSVDKVGNHDRTTFDRLRAMAEAAKHEKPLRY